MKKISSFMLAVCMLATTSTVFASPVINDRILEENVVTKFYSNHGNSDMYKGDVAIVSPRLEDTDIDGGRGVWKWGVKGLVTYSQYSDFLHKDHYHYANAMMNDEFTGRKYEDKGKSAYAETKKYSSYNTHRSYYGWE